MLTRLPSLLRRQPSAEPRAARWRPALAVALLGLGIGSSAVAGELSVHLGRVAQNPTCFAERTVVGSQGPLQIQDDCGFSDFAGSYTNQGLAGADYGELRASVATQSNVHPLLSGFNSGAAVAQFRGLYTFTGPGPSVVARLNLDLSGHLSGSTSRNANADLDLSVQGLGVNFVGTLLRLLVDGSSAPQFLIRDNTLDPTAPWLNLFGPGDAHVDIHSVEFVVPTGVALPLLVSLEASAGSLGSASLESDFDLTFDVDGPVFTLPDGFTVNGDGVVDNRWIGNPDPPPPPSAAPAPASLALVALGLALLGRRGGMRGLAARSRLGQFKPLEPWRSSPPMMLSRR